MNDAVQPRWWIYFYGLGFIVAGIWQLAHGEWRDCLLLLLAGEFVIRYFSQRLEQDKAAKAREIESEEASLPT